MNYAPSQPDNGPPPRDDRQIAATIELPIDLSHVRASMSAEIGELFAALSRAQARIPVVERSVDVAVAGKKAAYDYSYAPLEEIVPAAFAVLKEEGIAVTQLTDIGPSGQTLLVTIVGHKSGQWLRGVLAVKPTQANLQGLGSAITYARRYGLCAAIGIVTKNGDDDAHAAIGRPVQYAPQPYAQQQPYYPQQVNVNAQPQPQAGERWVDAGPQYYQPHPAQLPPEVAPMTFAQPPADDFPTSWGGQGQSVQQAQPAPEPPLHERYQQLIADAKTSDLVAGIGEDAKTRFEAGELSHAEWEILRAQLNAKIDVLFEAEQSQQPAPMPENFAQSRAA